MTYGNQSDEMTALGTYVSSLVTLVTHMTYAERLGSSSQATDARTTGERVVGWLLGYG
jgi:hypothetical protein